ncbi:energy-coupled thiamine transporter ThiT [Christensenellaceae bacterium OttesenSCG-928-L17]|nr:energy-coupled thiamine transporter ThiT [Christensenellaceae bacterium OttesenSCG-928-L17]
MEFTLFKELADLPGITLITLVAACMLVAGLVVALVMAARRQKQEELTEAPPEKGQARALVYGALCVALSFLLSYLKLFEMPQGGSITLCSMLPIALYANWFGLRHGLIAGFVCGILQFIQRPIAVHWLSPVLDYVLAFTCFGFAGLFKKSLPLGLFVGGVGRILCSTVSGAVFFAEYAPEGMNPWIYSTIYNTISLGPDALICIVVAILPPVKRVFERMSPVKRQMAPRVTLENS